MVIKNVMKKSKVCLIIMFSCSIVSCADNDKINGKYTIFVDSGMKRLRSNVISERKNIYPNIVEITNDNGFVLVKQIPDKKWHINDLGFDLFNIYCFYSNYLKNSAVDKKWDGLESDSVIYHIFKSRGASVENTSNDIRIRLNVADSLIANDPIYKKIFANDTNYWIIYEAKDTLIGPLSKSEYLNKRIELKIPDNLTLD